MYSSTTTVPDFFGCCLSIAFLVILLLCCGSGDDGLIGEDRGVLQLKGMGRDPIVCRDFSVGMGGGSSKISLSKKE